MYNRHRQFKSKQYRSTRHVLYEIEFNILKRSKGYTRWVYYKVEGKEEGDFSLSQKHISNLIDWFSRCDREPN